MAWGNVNIPLGKTALDLESGGTGSKTELINAPANSVIRKANEGYQSLAYTPSTKGAFYSEGENATPKFGTLPLTMGGTGSGIDINEAPDNAIIRKAKSTNSLKAIKSTIGAFFSEGTDKEPKFGILPTSMGGTGTGTEISNAPANALISKDNDSDSLSYVIPSAGALWSHGAYDKPHFGVLPLGYGGTGDGELIENAPINSFLIRGNTSPATLDILKTAKGALYSEGTNSASKFGTLPLNMGGTGSSVDLNEAPIHAIIKKASTNNTLTYIGTEKGAFFSEGTNQEPQFGILPTSMGGTGTDFSNIEAGGILAKGSSNNIVYWNVLPISKGGTGGSTAPKARTALGLDRSDLSLTASSNINTTSSSLALLTVPHLKLCVLRGYIKLKEELPTGTMLIVATVPESYRPSSTYSLNAFYSGTGSIKARVRGTDGAIQIFNTIATPTSYDVYVSGIWAY